MKLLRGIQHLAVLDKGAVATVGNFDGVHLGHQYLLKSLRTKANNMGLPLVLVLFEPQPREYFQQSNAPVRLTSLREKLELLKQCQVDYVYCIKFNDKLAQISATDFANNYLFSMLKVKYLLIGRDFRFGNNRSGDVGLLQALGSQSGCDVQVFSDFCIEGKKISSTTIRAALQTGELNNAANYLGRTYSMCARVVAGDGRGRQWGIPTANLGIYRNSLPLQGVFVVQVYRNSKIVFGVANVGKRPTVDGTKNSVEVHLFDFDESIYGELLQVFFLHKLRDELKFTTVDALIAQIHNDIAAAQAFRDATTNNIFV
ncbi:MAG: bifunctional riboflavin kinase/FAD synthetase [Legionellales bacterium]